MARIGHYTYIHLDHDAVIKAEVTELGMVKIVFTGDHGDVTIFLPTGAAEALRYQIGFALQDAATIIAERMAETETDPFRDTAEKVSKDRG